MLAAASDSQPPSATVEPRWDDAQASLKVSIRGRSVLALVVAPQAPLADWLHALDAEMRRAPELLAGRPVIADLAGLCGRDGDPRPLVQALDALVARRLGVIGAEG